MNGFKQCPNGHYYAVSLHECPYCKGSNPGGPTDGTIPDPSGIDDKTRPGGSAETETQAYVGGAGPQNDRTQAGGGMDTKTQMYGGGMGAPGAPGAGTVPPSNGETEVVGGYPGPDGRIHVPGAEKAQSPTHTVFGDEVEFTNMDGSRGVKYEERSTRKLVGWLVSYSFDRMGVDFKLYEGRNTIGHNMDNNITVNDPMMSGKHAVILFRENKYKIRDEMSSHGTFVNGVDIEDEHYELHDGDTIKLGKTVFKFRSSL